MVIVTGFSKFKVHRPIPFSTSHGWRRRYRPGTPFDHHGVGMAFWLRGTGIILQHKVLNGSSSFSVVFNWHFTFVIFYYILSTSTDWRTIIQHRRSTPWSEFVGSLMGNSKVYDFLGMIPFTLIEIHNQTLSRLISNVSNQNDFIA